MPACYLVPGYFGSELWFDQALTDKLWVNYAALALGWVGCARLAADGVAPGPPDGVALSVGGALEDYYAAAYRALAVTMAGSGYDFVPWGFDWRRAIPNEPSDLAAHIRANVQASDPCTIVAFSLGGLFTRAAWSDLVATGDQVKVRRIVTIGSPHQGSYLSVQAWSFDYPFLWQMQALAFLAPVLNVRAPHLAESVKFAFQIIPLSATWPSMYCALPLLGGSESAGDPHRAELYSAANWPAPRGVSQAHLDFSRNTTGPWLLSSASTPPSWVLTTIAGSGVPTVKALGYPDLIGRSNAYYYDQDGDGVVTIGSALMDASRQWVVPGRHSDLPLLVSQSGLLKSSILEVRNPPTPPPPRETMPMPLTPILAGPPVPALTFQGPVAFRPGDC